MAVPRGKHTKGKRGDIRMHHFIKEPSLISCPKCGVLKKPHFVCESCGYYKKEEVINVLEKLNKKERKKKEKEMVAKEKEDAKKPPTEDKK
ncbi:MAG: 50S ribosomal protein L32 [Patescibacteria group bacterium]|nr:50S ribosomal protein L32 [Patescibacteria group bacterium]MBU1876887.1 50S ribosomal protein L32 [Patescibacteria group bacterium]